jgi:hypothetical protein
LVEGKGTGRVALYPTKWVNKRPVPAASAKFVHRALSATRHLVGARKAARGPRMASGGLRGAPKSVRSLKTPLSPMAGKDAGGVEWKRRAMTASNHRNFSPLNVPVLFEGGRPPLCCINILNIIALPTQGGPPCMCDRGFWAKSQPPLQSFCARVPERTATAQRGARGARMASEGLRGAS